MQRMLDEVRIAEFTGTPITPEEYTQGVYAALPRGAKVELTTRHIEDRVAQMLGPDESQRTDSLARLKSMLHLPNKTILSSVL